VVRGGYGVYYTQLENDAAHQSNLNIQTIIPEVAFDGRGDFPMNPWGGAFPSFDQAQQRLCSFSLTPGCIRREITSEIPTTIHDDTYSHQALIGMARQLGNDLALEVSYQYTGQRREEVTSNQNLTYDPATGDPVPFGNIAARVYPEWGYVNGEYMQGWSNWHAFVTSVTKRFSDRWQFSGNYTFGAVKDSVGPPCQTVRASDPAGEVRCVEIPFNLRPDIAGEYTYAATDQRHRAVANGIWNVGRGFQLSGLYFYGSGMRTTITCSACLALDNGVSAGTRRRDDGSIIERNSFVGTALHRVDVRFQQRIGLGGNRSIDGILEVFNLFDYSNFGTFTTDVSSPDYGRPVYDPVVSYGARSAQLGFRFAF
jgi:hypothetical protein